MKVTKMQYHMFSFCTMGPSGKLSWKFHEDSLGLHCLSYFGHKKTLGRKGSRKKQPSLIYRLLIWHNRHNNCYGEAQEAFLVCNTMDGPMLCCWYRLACPNLCSILLSHESMWSSQTNPLAGILCMVLSLLRERAGRKYNLKGRTQNQVCRNRLTSSDLFMCVYKKTNKEVYYKCSNLLESKCTRGNNDSKLCLCSAKMGNAETKATSIPVQKHPPEPSTTAETNHQQAEQDV